MTTKATVLAEQVQTRNGVEYVTLTCMEQGEKPLLQMFDYGLKPEEKSMKGTLVGKSVIIQWETIRAIFAGRPQVSGHMVVGAVK